MPQAFKMSDAVPNDIEKRVEKAAAAATEEAVPPEFQKHAETAAAVGFVFAVLRQMMHRGWVTLMVERYNPTGSSK